MQQLIGDPRIPVERRVLWSLKALAGLRHGEAAALRWRHYDTAMEPLGRLTIAMSFDSHAFEEKRTKTETTRYVPVHPLLAEILKVWHEQHWESIFGRKPDADDLIVPGPELVSVNKNDACRALKFDSRRSAYGLPPANSAAEAAIDLRSWFKTATIEDGADSDLTRTEPNFLLPPNIPDVPIGQDRAQEAMRFRVAVGLPLFAAAPCLFSSNMR